jgi:RimJ/RimL family protein N-acetyltransferase
LFAIYSDPQTQVFNPSGPLRTEDQARALLQQWLDHWQAHGYGWWAIATRENPEHVIGFGGIAWHDYLGQPKVNLGYRFAVEAWGKGLATETASAALDHAFQTLRLPEVFAFVRPTHIASIRVLEKVGMTRHGELDDVPGEAASVVFRITHHH